MHTPSPRRRLFLPPSLGLGPDRARLKRPPGPKFCIHSPPGRSARAERAAAPDVRRRAGSEGKPPQAGEHPACRRLCVFPVRLDSDMRGCASLRLSRSSWLVKGGGRGLAFTAINLQHFWIVLQEKIFLDFFRCPSCL